MITRKSTRRKMGLVSVALVASIIMQWLIIPEIKWDAGVNADGLSFDSSTMINYQTILGGSVDYGVVCDTLNQTSHSETTWACNTFINTNGAYNNDVDYLTSTAHFLMGSLDVGSKVSFGSSTASALYIEAPSSVFGFAEGESFAPTLAGRAPGNFNFTNDFDIDAGRINNFLVLCNMTPTPTPFESPVMQVVNADASSNVNRLINRMAGDDTDIGWSAKLANRAASSSSYCLNPNGYCDYFYSLKGVKLDGTINTFENCQKLLINLTDPMFAGQVVYINVTSDMITYFTRGDGVWIFKDDSTNVVFNIADDAYTGESLNLQGPRLIITNIFPEGGPNGDGNQDIQAENLTCTYNFKSGETAKNGGTSTDNNHDAVTTQQHYNQSIIWNILESGTVNINNMGGVMLFPNATTITASGNNTGWLVAKNRFDMGAEFHFLYSGKSDDSVGQMHFALRKAFAEGYGHKGDYAEDSSVSFGYGAFDFIWQEYTDETYTTTMGDSQPIPVEATSYVILPKLSFADPTDQEHYIPKPESGTTSVPFYFRVTESQEKTIANVENSQGRIDIQLTVTVDSSGSYTYKVSYTSISGDNTTVYDSGSNIRMSGVQFDLGAFINKKTTTTPGSIEISKTIGLGNNVSINDIQEITFYVKDGDQIVKTIYLDPKNPGTGWTVSDSGDTYTFIVDDLVVGKEYTVVEFVSGIHDDIVLSPTSDVVNKTVRASAAATLPDGAKAAFTNDYTTATYGYIKVVKTLTGITLDLAGDINFTVTGVDGITIPPLNSAAVTAGTWTKDGNTYTYVVPTAIAVGTQVTVSETEPTSPIVHGNTTYTLEQAPAAVNITIVEGTQTAAQAASFTNTYTSTTATYGYIKVVKTLTGITLDLAGDINFTVTGVDGITIPPLNSAAVTAGTWTKDGNTYTYVVPTAIAVGTQVTVSETEPTSPIVHGNTTYTLEQAPAAVNITIVEGTQTAAQAASFTNTYTSTTATYGYIKVVKTLTGITLDLAGDINFTVTGVDGITIPPLNSAAVTAGTWTKDGNTYTYVVPTAIAVGTQVTVSETEPTSPIVHGNTTYTLEQAPAAVNITIVEGTQTAAQAASFTNTYTSTTATYGYIKVVKTLTGITLDLAGDINFTVTGVDGITIPPLNSAAVTAGTWTKDGNTYTYVVPTAIAVGTQVTVSETEPTSPIVHGNTTYTLEQAPAAVNITIVEGTQTAAQAASFTNTYTSTTATYGYIKVVKTLTGITLDLAGDINFTVTGVDGITIPPLNSAAVTAGTWTKDGNTYTYVVPTAIAVGTQVTVSETEPTSPIVHGNTTYTLEQAPAAVTVIITEGTQATAQAAAFTNTYSSTTPTPTGGETTPTPTGGETTPTPTGGETTPTPTGGETTPTPTDGETTPTPTDGETTPTPTDGVTTPTPTDGTEPTPTDDVTTPTPTDETEPSTTPGPDDGGSGPVYGSIIISKSLIGAPLNELDNIVFVLTDTSCGATREVPALNMENVSSGLWGDAGNGSYYFIVTGLTPGVTYTVAETIDGHTTVYALVAESSTTTGSATVVANSSVDVSMVNVYTSTLEPTVTPEPSETVPSETVPTDDTTAPTDDNDRVDNANRSRNTVDSTDRSVSATGETSVNIVAAVIMLFALVLVFTARKLREEAKEND